MLRVCLVGLLIAFVAASPSVQKRSQLSFQRSQDQSQLNWAKDQALSSNKVKEYSDNYQLNEQEAAHKTQLGTHPCLEPTKIGPCLAYIPRYTYNGIWCTQFNWGGCQPNGNNFPTETECNRTCVYNEDVCSLPTKVGPCRAAIPRYTYDIDLGKCRLFYWGGCQPNGNNFVSADDCKSTCETGGDVCSLPLKTGHCKAYFTRWGFDTTKGKCVSFIYGGCDANKNNFETEEECESQCGGPYSKHDKPSSHYYQKNADDNDDDDNEDSSQFSNPQYGNEQNENQNWRYNQNRLSNNQRNLNERNNEENDDDDRNARRLDYNEDQRGENRNWQQQQQQRWRSSSNSQWLQGSNANEDENEPNAPSGSETRNQRSKYENEYNADDDARENEDNFADNLEQDERENERQDRARQWLSPSNNQQQPQQQQRNQQSWRSRANAAFDPTDDDNDDDDNDDDNDNKPNAAARPRDRYEQQADSDDDTDQYNERQYPYANRDSGPDRNRNQDICTQPPKMGPCKDFIPRFFYNHETGQCQSFIYGGCQSNKNNFETFHECQRTCILAQQSNLWRNNNNQNQQ